MQGLVDYHRADAVRILDFAHAAEYISEMSQAANTFQRGRSSPGEEGRGELDPYRGLDVASLVPQARKAASAASGLCVRVELASTLLPSLKWIGPSGQQCGQRVDGHLVN